MRRDHLQVRIEAVQTEASQTRSTTSRTQISPRTSEGLNGAGHAGENLIIVVVFSAGRIGGGRNGDACQMRRAKLPAA
jgi:hypothetical protein